MTGRRHSAGKPLKAVWLRLSSSADGPLHIVARSVEPLSPDDSSWTDDPVLESRPPRGRVPVLLLHADDAMLLELQPPPVAARHRQAALAALVEPMWPGPLDEITCRFSAPDANGQVLASLFPNRVLDAVQALIDSLPPAWRANLHVQPLESCGKAHRVPAWQPAHGKRARHTVTKHLLGWSAFWLMLLAAALGLDAWRHEQAAHALRSAVEAEFRSAFPQVPVVLDPVAQARRLGSGGAGSSPVGASLTDLLALLVRHESALMGSITALTWREGSWSLTLSNALAPSEPLRQALLNQGWQITADGEVWTLTRKEGS